MTTPPPPRSREVIQVPEDWDDEQLLAALGEAIIKGVPALGFPKISSLVGLIRRPAFSAAPL